MAGETVKCNAICLAINPWSQTSHVVHWLAPHGTVGTIVKGAVRPKSAFLGQYDLNYTCEIVYYARAKGELHPLREATPLALREELRANYRALALAGYYRHLTEKLAPCGPDAADWFALLEHSLDMLLAARSFTPGDYLRQMLTFELEALHRFGLAPEIEAEAGEFVLRGERKMLVKAPVAQCLLNPAAENNFEILLDAARVIGVFYTFHTGEGLETRRSVQRMIL